MVGGSEVDSEADSAMFVVFVFRGDVRIYNYIKG